MSEDRRINPAVGVAVTLVLGAAMVYLGMNLIALSLWIFQQDGSGLAAFGLGAVGIGLVVLPALILLSQLRAWAAVRRGSGRAHGGSGQSDGGSGRR